MNGGGILHIGTSWRIGIHDGIPEPCAFSSRFLTTSPKRLYPFANFIKALAPELLRLSIAVPQHTHNPACPKILAAQLSLIQQGADGSASAHTARSEVRRDLNKRYQLFSPDSVGLCGKGLEISCFSGRTDSESSPRTHFLLLLRLIRRAVSLSSGSIPEQIPTPTLLCPVILSLVLLLLHVWAFTPPQ